MSATAKNELKLKQQWNLNTHHKTGRYGKENNKTLKHLYGFILYQFEESVKVNLEKGAQVIQHKIEQSLYICMTLWQKTQTTNRPRMLGKGNRNYIRLFRKPRTDSGEMD